MILPFSLLITFVAVIGLCWGSFLNMLAHRLLHGISLLRPRSHCPECDTVIAWYDNIPLISWIALQGHCRQCRQPISFLYPFTEIITAASLTGLFILLFREYALYQQLMHLSNNLIGLPDFYPFLIGKFISYSLFFSLLLIATRTDLEAMLIPQIIPLIGIPCGIGSALIGWSDITPYDSMIAAIGGYGFLWLIGFVFKKIRKQDGIGVGDMELLAMIGSFTGLFGIWISLFMGSLVGSLAALLYCRITRQSYAVRIPFGPFLALGALICTLFRTQLLAFLL